MNRWMPGWGNLVMVMVLAIVCVRCQELPSEPEPVDLSNEQPRLGRDTLIVAEDDSIRANVLINDSSLVGQALSLAEMTRPPQFGTARILDDDDQSIQYVPQSNYHGLDSLEYRVSGDVLSSNAWAIIFVTSVNDAPVATDDRFMIDEEEAIARGRRPQLVRKSYLMPD